MKTTEEKGTNKEAENNPPLNWELEQRANEEAFWRATTPKWIYGVGIYELCPVGFLAVREKQEGGGNLSDFFETVAAAKMCIERWHAEHYDEDFPDKRLTHPEKMTRINKMREELRGYPFFGPHQQADASQL
jgi:hypothetical protein